MQKILLILSCLCLSSCVIFQNNKKYEITDFPIKPPLETYTKDPVIKKIDNDFLVTDEMIINTTLLVDYYKRIEKWKDKHLIK
jgi:hypothetical protein